MTSVPTPSPAMTAMVNVFIDTKTILACARLQGLGLPYVAIGDGDAEEGFFLFDRVDGEWLGGLLRIVAAPEPGEGFGKIESGLRSAVSLSAEAEMEIVVAELEGVGHLDVLHRPRAVIVFEIVGAVAHPDANVAFGLLADFEGIDISTFLFLLR